MTPYETIMLCLELNVMEETMGVGEDDRLIVSLEGVGLAPVDERITEEMLTRRLAFLQNLSMERTRLQDQYLEKVEDEYE